MKGKKGIIRHQQKKSERNTDDDKLEIIGTALAQKGINYARNVFLDYDKNTGKLIKQGLFVDQNYHNSKNYQINNCDIVASVAGKNLYIELDGEGLHGMCDCAESITAKTRERNRRYTRAGLIWCAINETLANFVGIKKADYGDLTVFLCLSFIQKFVAISDLSKE